MSHKTGQYHFRQFSVPLPGYSLDPDYTLLRHKAPSQVFLGEGNGPIFKSPHTNLSPKEQTHKLLLMTLYNYPASTCWDTGAHKHCRVAKAFKELFPCTHPSTHPSIHTSTIHLPIYPSILLSIYPSIHLPIFPSICPHTHPSIHQPTHSSTHPFPILPFISLAIQPIFPSILSSFHPSLELPSSSFDLLVSLVYPTYPFLSLHSFIHYSSINSPTHSMTPPLIHLSTIHSSPFHSCSMSLSDIAHR